MMQTKSFKFKINEIDADDPGVFTGYASTFGNEDIVGDVFDKGAFKRTAKARGKGLPILLSHDHKEQIGLNLEMEEDDYGLLVKGELMISDIPKARETYAIIKRSAELGRSMGLSVGFIPRKDKWVDGNLHYKEVELFEYSVTPFAANSLAEIGQVRDANATQLSTAHQIFLMVKRMHDAGYENDPAQLNYILQSIERLKALADSVATESGSPITESDPVFDHSLLANLKSQLAGVGHYGHRESSEGI